VSVWRRHEHHGSVAGGLGRPARRDVHDLKHLLQDTSDHGGALYCSLELRVTDDEVWGAGNLGGVVSLV
jgi:hypothetical protein